MRGAQNHVASFEIEPGGAHVAPGGHAFLRVHFAVAFLGIFLDQDRVRTFRNLAAGEDAHALARIDPAGEGMARRRLADARQRRGQRGEIGRAHGVAVHRGDGGGRLGQRRGHVGGERAPVGAVESDGFGAHGGEGYAQLLQTNEHGEFKYGTMRDGAETYQVITYGRIVPLSRQAIVNDDMRAFDRLTTAFGFSARRLENRLVYAQLTSNPTMADGGALFNATAVTTAGGHANLALCAFSAGRLEPELGQYR